MSITRRDFCQGSAALALGTIFAAQTWPGGLGLITPAAAQTPSNEDLMVAGSLGDMWQGSETAPVTIIEYASMTCGHCAHFHATTYPLLKKNYIDTGKVRYTLREFPLDPLSAAGFLLARCASKDNKERYYAVVDVLFSQQKDWVVQKPIEPLMRIAKQAGFTQESFEQCLSDKGMADAINAVRDRGAQKLGVNSTPTFFINGKMHRGDIPLAELEKMMEPFLKS